MGWSWDWGGSVWGLGLGLGSALGCAHSEPPATAELGVPFEFRMKLFKRASRKYVYSNISHWEIVFPYRTLHAHGVDIP